MPVTVPGPDRSAEAPLWRFEYVKLDGTSVAEVTHTRDRRITFQLNGPSTVEFTMNLLDPAMDDVLSNPHGLILCYKRNKLVLTAETTSLQLVGNATERSIRVLGTEAGWVRLEKRLIGQGINGTFYESLDRGDMVVRALAEVNAIADTQVSTGSISATNTATAGPFYFKPVSELIRDLGEPLNGFDWWFSPGQPTDGDVAFLNIATLRGGLRDDAIFEFGTGRVNIREYELQIDNAQIITRAISLPPTYPDNLGLAVVSAPQLDYPELLGDAAATLAVHWRLGETAGSTAEDSSGFNRDGTYVGYLLQNAIKNSPPGVIERDSDKAKFFNGADTYVSSTYNPFANSSVRTFEGWALHAGGAAGTDIIFASDNATQTNVAILAVNSVNNNVTWESQSTGSAANNAVFVWHNAWPGKDEWVHWAFIYDETNDTGELFINGVSEGQQTDAGAYSATPGNFRLGAWGVSGGSRWHGRMDEVAIYTGTLTATEVLHHASQGRSQGIDALLGQRELVIDSELADEDLRQFLVDEHVALRAAPRSTFIFQPHINDDTGRVPSFLEDYDVGDIIRGRVLDSGLLVLDGLVRVYGSTVELDNEGTEAVTLTVVDEQ